MKILSPAVLAFLVCGFLFSPALAAGSSTSVSFSFKVIDQEVSLSGQLYRPEGREPAPAVVLMHGCSGVWSLQHEWAKRLQGWGYVALVLDSFGPRGVDAICAELATDAPHEGNHYSRVFDAYGANAYLSSLAFVDARRLALMGWSHGATVAQKVATGTAVNAALLDPGPKQFRSVIAFYPWCIAVGTIRVPLLILMGDADDWTPASRCRSFARGQKLMGEPVELVLYPGATHSFDGTELGEGIYSYGHFLRYDGAATSDAIGRVKQILANHLAD